VAATTVRTTQTAATVTSQKANTKKNIGNLDGVFHVHFQTTFRWGRNNNNMEMSNTATNSSNNYFAHHIYKL
jgi:hypothetical protein